MYECKVYTDEGRNKTWPEQFVRCPLVGEQVASVDGTLVYKVISITHGSRLRVGVEVPVVYVELVKR
jgi:hypothetical protein